MKHPTLPFDTLTSFHYLGTPKSEPVIAQLAAAGARIIGDSGAYSAMTLGKPIDIDQFAAWAERNHHHLAWVASLDAIGSAEQSWRNWQYLTRNGLHTVPTVHFGATGADLDRYADAGCDFIGLGGVAARKDRQRVLRWLVSMFRHARDHHPGMRFHGWGITSRLYLQHLPFYSVDSSGFGAGYRYGQVSAWDPAQGRTVTFRLDPSHAAKHWRLLREVYGVSVLDLSTSSPANRSLHLHMSVLTAQAMGRHYAARHDVPPPQRSGTVRDSRSLGGLHTGSQPGSSGVRRGTIVHYADTSPQNFRSIIDYLNQGAST